MLLICFLSIHASGQDTVNIKPFERYWTQPRLVPRFGVGIQRVAFAEVGIQWHKIYVHPLALASAGPYVSFEGIVDDDSFIAGPRIGYEVAAGLITLGADVTGYLHAGDESFALTPRAGLSVFGFVNLSYGYHVFLSDFRFSAISPNRLALTVSLNRDYFNVKAAPKHRRSVPGLRE